METRKPSVSPLRQRMIDDTRMRKLGEKTQYHYLRAVRQFAKYLGHSPDKASVEDLRNYQLYLVDHGVSPASLNSANRSAPLPTPTPLRGALFPDIDVNHRTADGLTVQSYAIPGAAVEVKSL